MADTQGTNEPEKVTQDAPMPSADQKTPSVGTQPQGGVDDSSQSTEQSTTEGLPDGVKERTRQEFDKLTDSNEQLVGQLRDERAQRQRMEDIFKTLSAPPQQQQVQQPQQPTPVYDPATGLINEDVLSETQKAAFEANQRAARAEAAVQKYLQDQEAREAFQAHPELDPQGRYGKPHDKSLEVATRRILTDAMLNPSDYGGKQLSFKEAGDLAKRQLELERNADSVKQQAKEEGAREAIEGVAPKEQASLEAEGTAGRVTQVPVEERDLVSASRRGDINALAARVSRLRNQPKS